jgi:ABC-type glycerol-3-phosphate transport system substrate-binding protein
MKKLSFVMCAMLIALCTVFVGCKKDAPSIKFTYDGVEKSSGTEVDAKVGDEVTIIVEYDAPGAIKQIDLRIGTDPNEVFTSGFEKKTTHKITRTIIFEDSGNTQIKTSVMDKQKDANPANFELKVKVRN